MDGSTREALRTQTQRLRPPAGLVLAGKGRVRVEAFRHRPLGHLSTEDALANDKRLAADILATLPVGGLLLFALGFCSLLWCDDYTPTQRFFVTRMREKIASRTVQVLSQGPSYRDEIIQVGLSRSNPCWHPLRMGAVLWQGAWERYRTNVLAPQTLTARQVGARYRRRWRIEAACAVTKRLLDLA